MTRLNTISNDEVKYNEHKILDESLRELQDETLNKNWGYWHFSQLDLIEDNNLESRLLKTLSKIIAYKEPFVFKEDGKKHYIQARDLNNLRLTNIDDLRNEIILKADYYSTCSVPSSIKLTVSEKYHELKYIVADNIYNFLFQRVILQSSLVEGIDTFYTFGGDHMGDDIIVETKLGVYVIHFGFSS